MQPIENMIKERYEYIDDFLFKRNFKNKNLINLSYRYRIRYEISDNDNSFKKIFCFFIEDYNGNVIKKLVYGLDKSFIFEQERSPFIYQEGFISVFPKFLDHFEEFLENQYEKMKKLEKIK